MTRIPVQVEATCLACGKIRVLKPDTSLAILIAGHTIAGSHFLRASGDSCTCGSEAIIEVDLFVEIP